MRRTILNGLGLVIAIPLLAGCGKDMSDLLDYVAEVKSRKSTVIEPIPQIKPYEPFAYSKEGSRSPFDPPTERSKDFSIPEFSGNTLQPDFNRNKEPLEEFPLEGLRMVGTLAVRNDNFALIASPDGVVHRVSDGNHMGQNFGKIIGISEIEVRVEEIVPDGFGGYVKRPAKVAISNE